jgi:hypothetical protein
MHTLIIVLGFSSAIALAACDSTDKAEHLHRLRAECGRDARIWADRYETEMRRSQPHWEGSLNSHYNLHDGVCYAEEALTTEPQSGDFGLFTLIVLANVDENTVIGEFRREDSVKNPDTPSILLQCRLADQRCKNADGWQSLAKSYMER